MTAWVVVTMEDNVERVIEVSRREAIESDEPVCGVCHKPRSWHDKDSVRHQFDVSGKLMAKVATPDIRSAGASRGDPILRLLLIRKGIISVEEIENAEKELKALGVSSVGSVTRSSGEDLPASSDDPRG